MTGPIYAAIEAGGTKFLCAVADSEQRVLDEVRINTTNPDETFAHLHDFYKNTADRLGSFAGAGIGTFGPIDLDPASPSYGQIVSTPKPGWSGANILSAVKEATGAEALIDTDVNAAALAELLHGAGKGLADLCYVTVGTGIGVGIVAGGKPLPTAMHAEAGHIRVQRAIGDDYAGHCPFHGDCLEGLASGPAIADRWGVPGHELPDEHAAWDLEAYYIAQLCANLTYTVRPQRIVLGGGIFGRSALYGKVRKAFADLIAGYAPGPAGDPDAFIAEPGLRSLPPGLVGAIELAIAAGRRAET